MSQIKNNLQEQLALYRQSLNSTTSCNRQGERRTFTFKRLSHGNGRQEKTSIHPIARSNSHDNILHSIPTSVNNTVVTPTATVAPVTHYNSTSINKPVTKDKQLIKKSQQQSSPTIVHKPTTCTPEPRINTGPSYSPCSSQLSDKSVSLSPYQTSLHSQDTEQDQLTDFEGALMDTRNKRLKLMDEICEMLNEIPAASISTLFGLSAVYIQKKLAIRKKLISQESELKKKIDQQSIDQQSIPSSHIPDTLCTTSSASSDGTLQLPICISSPDSSPECHMTFHHTSDHHMGSHVFDCAEEDVEGEYICNDEMEMEDEEEWKQIVDTNFCNPVEEQHHSSYIPGSSINQASGVNHAPPVTNSTNDSNVQDNAIEFQSTYPHTSTLMNMFKLVFGLRQFRPQQLEAINAAILGEDCFVLMPTGGGKSLCYQLPALVIGGVTIVVSPLRSLIHDQVQKLCSLEVSACHLSGDVGQDEENIIYTELSIRDPGIKLLYVTPEKLVASQRLGRAIQALYSRQKLSRFVIDEAHCISSWGHDFRPDYKRLCELRQKFRGIPLIALTATATPRVRADILNQLHMENTKWFTQSFNRTNLLYSVVPKKPKKVAHDIVDLINSKFKQQSGIVYCLSRRDCEVVSMELNNGGIPSVAYHAGLSDVDRSTVQDRWIRDDHCKVVCATIAFGMGIDKPDVRFVIHHTIAKSVEGYYQESGRAGRDGRPAHCILFYNYGDTSRIRRLLMMEDNKSNIRQNIANLYRMVQYCENESDCRRMQLLEYFAEDFSSEKCKNSSTPCDNCQSRIPHSTQNVTDLVKLILQGIQRVPSRDQYTLVQYMDALRGTNSSRPFLQTLPLFNKGCILSKHDLERLLHMMVMKGVLAEDLQVGSHDNVISYVKLGPEAQSVINGRYGTILLKVKNKGSSSKTGSIIAPTSAEEKLKEECYQDLKGLRMKIAREIGKNPEVILAVTTLQDMSQKLPTSREEMLNVQGMTVAKWKNCCAEQFLKITSEFNCKMATLSKTVKSPFFSDADIGSKENCPPLFKRGKRKSTEKTSKNKRKIPVATSYYNSDEEFEPCTQSKRQAQITDTVQRTLPGFLPPPRK